ncbi:unnamed protein product [Darwinula stevensoni]|uniref:BTB domain-containing protein n=1 Tax=Darwinula stevensoni TaxID=69355 RepID=A0A7R8X857_9CRUS|nr:unnamed protein product [Darwinula stevensoni]CAG0881241.1 unnamed protein product [Darwinula stevensoni]
MRHRWNAEDRTCVAEVAVRRELKATMLLQGEDELKDVVKLGVDSACIRPRTVHDHFGCDEGAGNRLDDGFLEYEYPFKHGREEMQQKASDDQQFCLRWNDFPRNLCSGFDALRQEEVFVDVTLSCEGKHIKAHRIVLSSCSPYFMNLLKGTPCSHPIIILRDVSYKNLCKLLTFIYCGQVNISQGELEEFLQMAVSLQIQGLASDSLTGAEESECTSGKVIAQVQEGDKYEEEEDDNDDKDVDEKEDRERSRNKADGIQDQPGELGASALSYCLQDGKMDLNDRALFGCQVTRATENHQQIDAMIQEDQQIKIGDVAEKLKPLEPRPCPICNKVISNKGNLFVHGNLTGQCYKDEILQPIVLPYCLVLQNIGSGVTLQDDDARPHWAQPNQQKGLASQFTALLSHCGYTTSSGSIEHLPQDARHVYLI